MSIDQAAATAFLATHARLLDRRRHEAASLDGSPAGVLAALDGYRNADGGYGWGLEPDLRSPESQPAAALHAFEVFAQVAPVRSDHAVALCDWLGSVARPDGGLPFALPQTAQAGNAPWWAGADTAASSLQITAAVLAQALPVARHDVAVATHPWLDRAVRFCLARIEAMDAPAHAYELSFAIRFLDVLPETEPGAAGLLAKLARHVPASGLVPVRGGAEGETLRPLDLAPDPGTPARELLDETAVQADLDRLAGLQQPDGGWTVDYLTISPAGSLDWRGYATVRALDLLKRNGF